MIGSLPTGQAGAQTDSLRIIQTLTGPGGKNGLRHEDTCFTKVKADPQSLYNQGSPMQLKWKAFA